jgi:hypothetical protein
MLSFPQLERRILGLMADLDGELWSQILQEVNPPQSLGPVNAIHDLVFRDAKALAGYVPDIRAIIRKTSPKSLNHEEVQALISIRGFFNLLARFPVVLLTIPDHLDNEKLIDLYNGFRQIIVELDEYLALAKAGE